MITNIYETANISRLETQKAMRGNKKQNTKISAPEIRTRVSGEPGAPVERC